MESIKDRFWLWAHEAESHNTEWGLPGPSKITPVEAAGYMGISNLIMVRYGSNPLPLTTRDVIPFRGMRQVVWSVVGASGTHFDDETERVLHLPSVLPNMTGVMMDDFFKQSPDALGEGALSVEELVTLQKRLSNTERKLDLWVVLYDHQLDLPVKRHLELCDKVSFWIWDSDNLEDLESMFEKMEEIVPKKCGKILGCYLWDYGKKRPMPIAKLERQFELGLRWLQEDRIEGMIFLASCICDLELEAVELARQWINSM